MVTTWARHSSAPVDPAVTTWLWGDERCVRCQDCGQPTWEYVTDAYGQVLCRACDEEQQAEAERMRREEGW